MGNIQNTFNTALGAAAKGATAVAGIQAMQAGETVKALEEREGFKDELKENLEDLKFRKEEEAKALADQKTAQENYDIAKKKYEEGPAPMGTIDQQYQVKLELEDDYNHAQSILNSANIRAQMEVRARKEQIKSSLNRKKMIDAKIDAYNKTARRRGVSKIKKEELYKEAYK